MDNTILYTAKFTHHDLKCHKVWWKLDKRCGSWFGQTDRPIPIYPPKLCLRGVIKIHFYLSYFPYDRQNGTQSSKSNDMIRCSGGVSMPCSMCLIIVYCIKVI
jgi:hypothetical protein